MRYSEQDARRAIVLAGRALTEKGLVSRTWGNISARISDDTFLITPSGRAYESLTENDLVAVDIHRLSYDKAGLKPSSEKGIHAAAYRLRRDANFIIHTHQTYASAVGVAGESFSFAPTASYGLPGTKKLWERVERSVAINPDEKAFLLQKHGVFCLGESMEDAFRLAAELERVSEQFYHSTVSLPAAEPAFDLGSSYRDGEDFVLTCFGQSRRYPLGALPDSATETAKLHDAVYRDKSVSCILSAADGELLHLSRRSGVFPPFVDDFAQIAGETVHITEANRAALALRGRNAVLVRGAGALVTGKTPDDAEAVRQIVQKNAKALCFAEAYGVGKPLSASDALLQRAVYRLNYAKKSEKRNNR